MKSKLTLAFVFPAAFLLSACTDYLAEFQDEYPDEYRAMLLQAEQQGQLPSEGDISSVAEPPSSSSVAPSSSGGTQSSDGATLTDARDGQIYKIVTIGTKIWMAQNLNYKVANSFCYANENSNCDRYGRLYLWSAAMDSVGTFSSDGKGCGFKKECSTPTRVRGVCPEGWHLPTKDEIEDLANQAGGLQNGASAAMRAAEGWSEGENGTDKVGFKGLPAGDRNANGSYANIGKTASFWTSTQLNTTNAYYLNLKPSTSRYMENDYENKSFSVRCIKD